MGSGSSSEICEEVALPQDLNPGPPLEYNFQQVEVTYSMSGIATVKNSSNVTEFYPTLNQHNQSGFQLCHFNLMPGNMQVKAFSKNFKVPFEAIYWRSLSEPSAESWDLRVERCMFNMSTVFGITSRTTTSTNSDSAAQLGAKVTEVASAGGRLVGVALAEQSMSTAGIGHFKHEVGVDVLFHMPKHPNPAHYTYMGVLQPVVVEVSTGLGSSSGKANADWTGMLNKYLLQGWRLAEIFNDAASVTALNTYKGLGGANGTVNTYWMFEKETSKIEENRQLYEGTIVDFWLTIKAEMGGSKSHTYWGPTVTEMGNRGWQLATMIMTSEFRQNGRTLHYKMLLFFQRKIL